MALFLYLKQMFSGDVFDHFFFREFLINWSDNNLTG